MELLGGASEGGESLTELYPAIISRKNKEYALEYSRAEYPRAAIWGLLAG